MSTKSIKVSEQAFTMINELKGNESVDQLLIRLLATEKANMAVRIQAMQDGKLTATDDKLAVVWANVKKYNEAQKASKEAKYFVMKSYGLSITFAMNRSRIKDFMDTIALDFETHYKKLGIDISEYTVHPDLRKKDKDGKYIFEQSMLR